jgi:hypothetical protein
MQILNILSSFPQHSTSHFPVHNFHETVNKDMPWDFFDGASQGNPTRGGDGGVLHLSKDHNIYFYTSIGNETNIFCELFLNLTLCLAREKGFLTWGSSLGYTMDELCLQFANFHFTTFIPRHQADQHNFLSHHF